MKKHQKTLDHLVLLIALALPLLHAFAQSVTIKEETMALETYGFGKPNPVPILAENPKIFPYFKFEEYEHSSQKKDWKVITLENEYIKVMVLPEIGGKVWGAIEKSTGEEFLYKNEVVKFRNISMRGPWTSGGIEFNFGIIGHHPSTATPVDYRARTNEDGSVSCIVGTVDLPSNTHWRVEMRLEKDKAYFETKASWYNASPLTESYYNWMTAAAVATYDLEFFIPGNAYVEHNGNAHTWPVDDQGRNLSFYKNNTFGPSKSYHVVGEYNDFFGGYYHDSKFGFGQWAPYEEMPGQKLWLWNLSRAGGIWEDLLTDTDGQYIEFQAGRLFDQYFPGATNPISQVGFDPYLMDQWREIWFPYKEIGGMVDASEHGVLNVENGENELYVGLNALQRLDRDIQISINGEIVLQEKLALQPMEVFSKKIPASPSDKIIVEVHGTELYYNNDPDRNLLKRPFYPDENLKVSQTEQLFQEGLEALEYRDYITADENLRKLVQIDPSHRQGLTKLAELEYRKTNYEEALEHANAVLRMDTYDPAANYIAGIAYRTQGHLVDALESLGWAARDIKFRSVSYAQMAEIYLATKSYDRAKMYAQKGLDFNTYNLNARKVLAVTARKEGDTAKFREEIATILKIDPLNLFAAAEKGFMEGQNPAINVQKTIHNEFPAETMLSLAIEYRSLGLMEEAIEVLGLKTEHAKNKLWLAYLEKDKDPSKSTGLLGGVLAQSTEFVFPYRRETLPVLEWAVAQNSHWKLRYYLAQNYIAVGRLEQGKSLLKALGNEPDSDVFYRFRAAMLKEGPLVEREADLGKALELKRTDWKVWEETIQFYLQNEKYAEAYQLSNQAYKKFSGNYNIGLAHAKALLNTDRHASVLKVLKNIQVLPYEHASESREIYERAHLGLASAHLQKKDYKAAISVLEASKKWPEHIGVGKPYGPDERLQDYLLAMSYGKVYENDKKKVLLQGIARYTGEHISNPDVDHLYGLWALQELGNQDELDQLLSKLKSTAGADDPRNGLALELFKDNAKVDELLQEERKLTKEVKVALRSALNF